MKSHGMTGTRTYRIWVQMRRRCRDPRAGNFANYGGRGIRVCDAWNNSFETFLTDMGECPVGMSIERKNCSGNYEPGNCTWATAEEQNNNRRSVELIKHDGKCLSLKQWSREIGVNYGTLNSRKRAGLTGAELLSPYPHYQMVEHNGRAQTIAQWARELGVKKATIISRLNRGLSSAEVLSTVKLLYPKNRKSREF